MFPAIGMRERKRSPKVVSRLRQSTLIQGYPPSIVQERDSICLREEVEDRIRVVGVVQNGVAETKVREGEVDAESGVGEEEEGVAFRGGLSGAVSGNSEVRYMTHRVLLVFKKKGER